VIRFSAIVTYILNLLPAFSIIIKVVGIYISSRFLSLIFAPFIIIYSLSKKTIIKKFMIPIFFMLILFFLYVIMAIFDSRNIMIYLGYVISFLYIILLYFYIEYMPKLYINFFVLFFILNVIFVILQLFFLNLGFNNLAMIHSNLPAQINYHIPVFIQEPFFRYTGLFNESSPFGFYLAITFTFFHSLGNKYSKLKYLTLILLIFSGAKSAYLFLLLHYSFFSKYRIINYIFTILLLSFFLAFFYFYEALGQLTYGQIASFNARFLDLFGNGNIISYFGIDLGKSSEGEVALNFYSIIISGFGIVGLSLIVLFFIAFYVLLKNKNKKYFIFPLIIGLLSSGSLLIVQYSFWFSSLFYLSKVRQNNE